MGEYDGIAVTTYELDSDDVFEECFKRLWMGDFDYEGADGPEMRFRYQEDDNIGVVVKDEEMDIRSEPGAGAERTVERDLSSIVQGLPRKMYGIEDPENDDAFLGMDPTNTCPLER